MRELAQHPRRDAVDRLLGQIRDTTAPLPDGLPPALRAFLDEEGLPAWADRARLLRAQRFAERNAMAIATALFCASLPSAFTAAKGVAVLYSTGRLEKDVEARVNETGRFVFDVLMPGGFESGTAVRATQKVRLLHAGVRHRAKATSTSRNELPINQEDMLGTLTCFSIVVLDALKAMGTSVSQADATDYLHLWFVVGAMLGIAPSLLPDTEAALRSLGERIGARQTATSAEGRKLAEVLLAGVERHLPARGLRLLAPGLMRFFLGEKKARVLGLPRGLSAANISLLLSSTRAWLGGGRALLELTMAHKLQGRPPSYQQPIAQATCPFKPSQSPR